MFDKLEDILIHFEEIMQELNEPNVTENQNRFRSLMKEQADLTPIVEAVSYTHLDVYKRQGVHSEARGPLRQGRGQPLRHDLCIYQKYAWI